MLDLFLVLGRTSSSSFYRTCSSAATTSSSSIAMSMEMGKGSLRGRYLANSTISKFDPTGLASGMRADKVPSMSCFSLVDLKESRLVV